MLLTHICDQLIDETFLIDLFSFHHLQAIVYIRLSLLQYALKVQLSLRLLLL